MKYTIGPRFRSSSNPNKIELKFYKTWISIRHRCSNRAKNGNKKTYFARGVRVCDRWQKFEYFFVDMFKSYMEHYKQFGEDTEIDRIDNGLGYTHKNCRWVTHRENTNNRRNRKTLKGKTLTEWAKILNLKRSTLAQRFYVYGWSVDRTLSK